MGFPKTVEQIDVRYGDTFAVELRTGGERALAVEVPRVIAEEDPVRIDAVSYSYLDGTAYGTPLAMDLASGVVDPGAVTIELGTGMIADELRSLGLPSAPDFCTYGEGLAATFQLGAPV